MHLRYIACHLYAIFIILALRDSMYTSNASINPILFSAKSMIVS